MTTEAGFPPRGLGRVIRVSMVLLGLTITIVATLLVRAQVLARETALFREASLVARTSVKQEIASQVFGLQGTRAFFAAKPGVTRDEFDSYISSRFFDPVPENRLQSAVVVVFARAVTAEQALALEDRYANDAARKASGYPPFKVRPAPTPGSDTFVADYVSPVEGNESIVAFDLGSEENRRLAFEQARDTGEVVASGPVDLLQGGRGFVVANAIYDVAARPTTIPARRRHFVGVVSAGLLSEVLIEQSLASSDDFRIEEIYDVGATVDPAPDALTGERIVYDRGPRVSLLRPDTIPRLTRVIDLDVGTRRWRMVVVSGPGFVGPGGTRLPWITAIVGLLFTLLSYGLVTSFARTRERALLLASDMTVELNARDVQLQAANDLLEEKNAAMQEFVAIASHDLRSPVAVVLGLSETLLTSWDKVPDEQRQEFMRIILRRSSMLSELIDDLLTVTEIDGRTIEARPRAVEVAAVVEACLEGREASGWVVRGAARALVDPTHLRRMVTNLLSNAEKYGSAPYAIEVSSAHGSVSIAVCDQGQGVPTAFVPRLFERFARAEVARVEGKEGTGLGLGIVRGLARANGGDVAYEGNGAGSRFIITVPAASPDERLHDATG